MRRILIVSNFFPPDVQGGAEVVAYRQAKQLQAIGNEVVVFAGGILGKERATLPNSVELVSGIKVYRVGLRSLEPDENFFCPSILRRFEALLSTFRPDIVHVHNITGLSLDIISASSDFGAKVMITLHDHWGFCFKNTLLRNSGRVCEDSSSCAVCKPFTKTSQSAELPIRLRRDFVLTLLGYADALISPSKYLAQAYAHAPRKSIKDPIVISNGIDLEPFLVVQPQREANTKIDSPLHFSCFSYLGAHKGISTLLDAAEILARDDSISGKWKLSIAGHGYLESKVRGDIKSGRFGNHLTYHGKLSRQDAISLAVESDVTVLASIWPENEPVSLLEAIAAGSAQLASRIGGNLELVEEGTSGLLFEPCNPSDLAHKMRILVADPSLISRMKNYNLSRRGIFSEIKAVNTLVNTYNSPPSARNGVEEIIVACTGGTTPSSIHDILDKIHRFEKHEKQLRFIHVDWMNAALWSKAAALWIWSEGGADTLKSAARALRGGLPVIAPKDLSISPMLQTDHNSATYSNALEAAGYLIALTELPLDAIKSLTSPMRARVFSVIAPSEIYYLKGEVIS